MNIWALKPPSTGDYTPEQLKERLDFLADSATNGISRFGWSHKDEANLEKLKSKSWNEMSDSEVYFWKNGSFLKEICVGDWVVHINLPSWGMCIAGQVVEGYSFEEENNKYGDYRHMLKIDPNTVIKFDRNNERVLPIISSRLKLQGRYWRIYQIDDFQKTIENLRTESLNKSEDESVGLFYLKQELLPILEPIKQAIQKTHPGSKLENLIAEIFRKIPGVLDVQETGKYKGWGTDHGADLVVTYKSGLPIANLTTEEKLVIQVKSYVNQHWETNAVNQIETAISKYSAHSGLIITTGEKTKVLEDAVEVLNNKLNKPIALIAGDEVAKFVLTYGSNLIM